MASCTCFLALVITILTVGFAESVSDTCQGETIYSERGSRLEVQCDITVGFLALFWYRGTDVDNGQLILRIDGGSKTINEEGYDITDEGAMVINELQVEHEGSYFVRYLDNNGNPFDKTVSIYVQVSLRSNPSIEACASSSHEICRSIEESKLQNTLLCIAEETRPPVNITWNAFNGEEQQSWYNNTLNITTSLYTSTSLLEYNPKDFNLEYFTCDVTDRAVQEPRPVGMFVKGSNEDGVVKQEVQFLKSGSDLILECPKSELGEWGVRYPNGTYDLLWRKYPEYEGGSCLDTDRCEVEEDGTLVVNKVTFRDEGHYMCFSWTGQSDRIVENPVEVHVSPPLMKTVIKGCEDLDNCELNVANEGSLECFIFGSRPSIKPLITLDTTVTDIEVFIFGHTYSEKESTQPGTFDTKLYVEYTIPDCSEVVSIECTPGKNEHEDNINKSVVNLITATSGCGEESGGRPGLVVFLVLFFLFLVIIVIIVFYWKREYILSKLPQYLQITTRGQTGDQELGQISKTDADEKINYPMKLGKHEPIPTIENELTSEAETNSLQNKFNNSFQPIFSGIIAESTTPEAFKEMMKSFCTDNKVTIPIPFLTGFLKNQNVSNEQEVLKILHFVVDNFQNDWVGHFLKMLDELLGHNRISSTNYITLVGKLLQRRVIGLLRYVELSGSLLSESIAGFDLIMNELKGLVDKKYCSKEDFLSTLLRYYLNNYISEDIIMNELFSETETYHYMTPYFLQSTYQEFQQKIDSQSINRLCNIFKSVWENLMAKTIEMPIKLDNNSVEKIGSRKLTDSADEKFDKDALNKILQQALIEALIFSMDAKMIKTDKCVEMIQNTKVSQEEVEQHVSSYTHNPQDSADHGIEILEQTLMRKMISDEYFVQELWHFVTPKGKITFDEYMGKLKDFLRQKLLSDRCFEQKVTNLINGGETKKEKKKREEKEKKREETAKKREEKEKEEEEKEKKREEKEKKREEKGKKRQEKEKKREKMKRENKEHKTEEGETFLTTKPEYEWDRDRWIKFVTELANEDLIGKSSRTTLYQCVVTFHEMKKDDLNKMLKLNMKIEKNIREELIKKMKFP
ncbi:uncharacterized protein [Apostichopus japonicus]|uniref:uncharacterized protein n=1 Tax=Stichopus japonicus TaxID=307972 RepID=UPI003AB54622